MRSTALFGLVLLSVGLVFASCSEQGTSIPRFAVRVVDPSVDASTQQGPPGTDRFLNATDYGGEPGAWWLKREGSIEGPLVADAHVGSTPCGEPAVELAFTPEGREQFAAVTRANIGNQLAFVLNGRVLVVSLIGAEIADGRVMISGYYTEMEARALAADLVATSRAIEQ